MTEAKKPTLAERNEAARLYDEYAKLENDDDASADTVDAAFQAYDNHDLTVMVDDERAMRCGITGIPLIVSDEVVLVLKSALAWRDFGDRPSADAIAKLPEFAEGETV